MRKRSPLVSDKPHELLDHVELCALTDPDKNSSMSQLASELTITGSLDAVIDEEAPEGPDDMEGIIDAVFTEAEDRIRACGEENYPFTLERKAILSKDVSLSSVYTFLLLLSVYGEDAVAEMESARLFEDVCAQAVAMYLGCRDAPAESYAFGFPRRVEPKGFVEALENLCRVRIKEGEADKKVPDIKMMKDAGLDIVSWLPFPDNRPSKVIAFGQCATGNNWWGKRTELQPLAWCHTWLTKTPQVIPIKMFFVPHTVTPSEWAKLGYYAGVIFDRFRITYFAEQSMPTSLRTDLQKWSNAVSWDKD